MPRTQKNQQGVAAIEFALIITVLLTICFAIVSFGILMWTQQKVSHIAGDSTRVALQRSIEGNEDPGTVACIYALNMAKKDWLLRVALETPVKQDEPDPEEQFCVSDKDVSCPGGIGGKCLQLKITVPAKGLPLVNIVKDVGNLMLAIFSKDKNTDGWLPDELSATSTVKITDLSGA